MLTRDAAGKGKDRLLTDSPGGSEPEKPRPQSDADPLTDADPAKFEHDLRAMTRIVLEVSLHRGQRSVPGDLLQDVRRHAHIRHPRQPV
jgi:hypothetical protein